MPESSSHDYGEMGEEESTRLLRSYVVDTLTAKSKGDGSGYESLLLEFRQLLKDSQSMEARKKLLTLLSVLSCSVSVLDEKHHSGLCREIFSIKLMNFSVEIQEVLMELMINMIWADSALAPGCLQCLVCNLVPSSAPFQKVEAGSRWQPNPKIADRQKLVLRTISQFLKLFPTTAAKVVEALSERAPFPYRPHDVHCYYIKALFDLISYPHFAPVRDQILYAVIQHVVLLDAELKTEDVYEIPKGSCTENECTANAPAEDDIFELELNVKDSMKQKNLKENVRKPGAKMDANMVQNLIRSVDSLMEITLELLEAVCNAGHLKDVWCSMMNIFDAVVVNTEGSKFAQYTMYYLALQEPLKCSAHFSRHCFIMLSNHSLPPISRSAYCAYLASFLARCAFVPVELVVENVVGLVEECEKYARNVDAKQIQRSKLNFAQNSVGGFSGRGAGMRDSLSRHQVFYSMVQALLYILCYSMKTLIGQPKSPSSSHAENLRRIIQGRLGPILHHSLDPINVCSPAIAVQFAQQASLYKALDCLHLINASDLYKTACKLPNFFPFDPYVLPRSSRFLRLDKTYVKWRDRKIDVDNLMGFEQDNDEVSFDIGTPQSAVSIPISEPFGISPNAHSAGDGQFAFAVSASPMSVGSASLA